MRSVLSVLLDAGRRAIGSVNVYSRNTELPDPAVASADGHAVEVLLATARDHGDDLALVTLGPLTNVAAALLRDRDLLRRFRRTFCMAGAPAGPGA